MKRELNSGVCQAHCSRASVGSANSSSPAHATATHSTIVTPRRNGGSRGFSTAHPFLTSISATGEMTGTTDIGSEPAPRVAQPTLASTCWLMRVIALLVFLVGIQLFVRSDYTASEFAWTIKPPLTAAFMGAGYWAACL